MNCVFIDHKNNEYRSVDVLTSGILWEAALFLESNMCQGSYISCALTWHYDREYRNESVLEEQTCIIVNFACFQNKPQ